MATTISGSSGVTTPVGAVYNGIASGTAVSASGTAVDFTGIPSWVKRITVMFSGVTGSGTSNIQIQLGTSSGVTTTGYVSSAGHVYSSSAAGATSTTGLLTMAATANTVTHYGSMIISNLSGNNWVSQCCMGRQTAFMEMAGGGITLGGTLDRIRITTVNGTDTFTAGSINILYE